MNFIMFDFDGILTYKDKNIWKEIWKALGYDTSKESYFASLFQKFIKNEITHQEWCDLTCEAFTKRHMDINILKALTSKIRLINGAEETFKELKEKGFQLFIISGNITPVIMEVLGENVKYFDTISANDLLFNKHGDLIYIKGTNYDFEGKAEFIKEFKRNTGISAEQITFIGNGKNDEWAHLSGCKTICINPDDTDEKDSTKWHKVIYDVTDLRQIIPELEKNQEKYKN